MSGTGMTDVIWYDDLFVLGRRPLEFFPTSDQTYAERVNALTRLLTYMGLLMYAYNRSGRYLTLAGVGITLLAISFSQRSEKYASHTVDVTKPCTMPTEQNPLMNPLYGDDPRRPPACPYEVVKDQIAEKLDARLFKNVGDVYNNANGQRQFITLPNTSVPSDRQAFTDFCYGGSLQKTCKESTVACGRF